MSDALMGEDNARTVRRLRDILISFGAAAREYANELRNSREPGGAARRGRPAARPRRRCGAARSARRCSTTPMRRCSARRCARSCRSAPTRPTRCSSTRCRAARAHTRDAIMQALGAFRDEKAAPLFMLHPRTTPTTRAAIEGTYTPAVESLGKRRRRRAIGRGAEGDPVSRRVVGARPHRAHPLAAARALRSMGTRAPTRARGSRRRRGPAASARSPRPRSPSRRRAPAARRSE